MFYIIRDTLVKEVLYPPKNGYSSFLYRFEWWKNRKTSCAEQNSNDHEKFSVFSEKHAGGLLSSIKALVQPSAFHTNSLQLSAVNAGNKMKTAEDSKSRSQGDSVKQYFVPKESINRDFDSSKNIDIAENSTEQEVRHSPYRSYRSSRLQNLKGSIVAKKQNSSNATSDTKRNSRTFVSQRVNENGSLSQSQKLTNIKTKREEKVYYSKLDHKYPPTPSSSKPRGQNSGTFIKLKTSISKEAHSDRSQLTIAKKHSPSSGDVQDSRPIDIRKRKTGVANNLMRNLSAASETACKKTDGVSSQERIEQPTDIANEAERKTRTHPKTPSRIPVKNMHYGPPATFSKPFKAVK